MQSNSRLIGLNVAYGCRCNQCRYHYTKPFTKASVLLGGHRKLSSTHYHILLTKTNNKRAADDDYYDNRLMVSFQPGRHRRVQIHRRATGSHSMAYGCWRLASPTAEVPGPLSDCDLHNTRTHTHGARFRLRNDLYCVAWGVELHSLTGEFVMSAFFNFFYGNRTLWIRLV